MSTPQEDELQKNIRRTASVYALKEIHAIVDEERKTDESVARALNAFFQYGWVVLLLIAGIAAHFMGVF